MGPVMDYNLLSASAMRSRPASTAGRMPAAKTECEDQHDPQHNVPRWKEKEGLRGFVWVSSDGKTV